MYMIKKTNIRRVLLLALSILCICTSMNKAYGATTDDLRYLIGERRITDEVFISDIKKVLYQNQQAENTNELAKSLNDKVTRDYEETLDRLTRKRDERLTSLEESFSYNKPAAEVIAELGGIYSIMSELADLKQPNIYTLDELYEEKPDIAYEYAMSVMTGIENDFDLGVIGEGLRPPTLSSLRLKKTFGMYMEVFGSIEYKENTGINLVTGKDSTVVSQFNGTVTEIHKKNKEYTIKISHGPELITQYSLLKAIEVKKGQKVSQYDVIGYAASDSVHFEVILNTVPINPLFMYGGAGERAYHRWAAENPGMVYEETDFSNVKKYVEDIVKPQVTIVPSLVDDSGVLSNLRFDDGYIKPEVPAIAFDNDDMYNTSGD